MACLCGSATDEQKENIKWRWIKTKERRRKWLGCEARSSYIISAHGHRLWGWKESLKRKQIWMINYFVVWHVRHNWDISPPSNPSKRNTINSCCLLRHTAAAANKQNRKTHEEGETIKASKAVKTRNARKTRKTDRKKGSKKTKVTSKGAIKKSFSPEQSFSKISLGLSMYLLREY